MVCTSIDRFNFQQRKQEAGESINEYVAALKKLAIICKFGALHDEFVKDQIVMHTTNTSIQEKL